MDRVSYIRFGVWKIIILIYYVLYVLHASYDATQDIKPISAMSNKGTPMKQLEEGGSPNTSQATNTKVPSLPTFQI